MKLRNCILLSFLIYFLSIGFVYSQSNTNFKDKYLMPIGNITQIDAELQSLIVRNTFADSPFKIGDCLVSINNTNIRTYSDFSNLLNNVNSDSRLNINIIRNNENLTLIVKKEILDKVNFNNIFSGFATLTYVDPETNKFGAVAHPISVGCNKNLYIKNGSLSSTYNLVIDKSYRGCVGCINGQKNEFIGNFKRNTDFGIKGTLNKIDLSKFKKYKVANLNEVKKGKASIILQTSNDSSKEYEIKILNIKNQKNPDIKTFKIEIVDKELLKITGGVVQGMSGTPIIQNNKIIGAISHAVESNPSIGYGVYIGWMLEGE